MTPQEQEMIQGLIDRVQQTQLPEKDSDAEHLLQGTLGRNPDALYILSQTVLVQKYALDQAQKQMSDLRSQLDQARQQQQQPRHTTSFLGSLLGHSDPAPPPPPLPASSGQAATGYAPVPGYAPQAGYTQAPPQYGVPAPGSQGGGFLRSALQTATGVAAGALAFQGIESLMHGFGGGGGFGGQQGFGGFGAGAPREEVINNYYGDSGQERSGGPLSGDIEDRRNDSEDRFAGDSGTGDDGSSLVGDDPAESGGLFDAGNDNSFDSGDDNSFDSGGDSGGGDDSSFS